MGLDAYAHAVEQGKKLNLEEPEFMYWRKNNALHGWMADLYDEKGGDDVEFNCTLMQLHAEDLEQLRDDIKAGRLKPTEGFFFGPQEYSAEQKEEDLEFVETALGLISDGFDIYYYAWY